MFKDEADFEKTVGRLNIDDKPNPAHREKLRRQMLSVFNETTKQSPDRTTVAPSRGRTIMKSPFLKLAAAAAILVVVAIGAYELVKPENTNLVAVDDVKDKTGTSAPLHKGTAGPVHRGTPDELVPIKLELPKPMFVGTPVDLRVENLEKPLGKPRPPFLAPVGTKNIAVGKPVFSSDQEPIIIGEIEMITDGDKEAADGSYVELYPRPFVQYITIDLEDVYSIYAIVVWHYHRHVRVYFDVVVLVADDPDFITNVRTLFNNDLDNSAGLGVGQDKHYVETYEGKLINAKGVKARYVRLYSKGNTANDFNHYIEVAVYGKPAE